MAAYLIAQIEVHDPATYQKYLEGFFAIFERYDGEILVSTRQEPTVLEGDWTPSHAVVLKFPSMEKAEAWYRDPDYQALARHRHAAAHANVILVEGLG